MANTGVTLQVRDRVVGGGVEGIIVLLGKRTDNRPVLATVQDDSGQFRQVFTDKLEKIKG